MGVALRKNSHRGYHDFLPPSRCPSLRLVPGTNQEIGTAKVRPSSVALVEYNGNNQLLARYTHSGLRTDDVLAADITSDGVSAGLAQNTGSYQYLKDAQGTVTDVADSSGNKLQQYVYSAFGELLGIKDAYGADVSAVPPVRTSYSYTGREYDSESGMLYYRARYYLPEIGRFLQKDPEPGRLDISSTVVNSYIYASNNPAAYTDPSGKSLWNAIVNTALFIGMAFLGPILLLVNPAWTLGNLMKTFNLSIPGQILNVAIIGKLAREDQFAGHTVVENSMFSGGVGFTFGPVSFLPKGASTRLRYHEIGHQLQYEKRGGWGYTLGATGGWIYEKFLKPDGGESAAFECQAGSKAHDIYELKYYPDAGYRCNR